VGPYRGGESRDWLKSKVFEIGRFVITAFQELGEGRLEALHVDEKHDGRLYPAGQVRFGFAGRGQKGEVDRRRAGPATKGTVPIAPLMPAEIKFFGRYKGGTIRRRRARGDRDDKHCAGHGRLAMRQR
jgi:ATP-dependent DNA ligase